MKELEFWGFIVTFIVLWITNIGGMGGGGMVVPISLLFFKFDAKNAVTVSNFSSFISSAQRCFLNRNQTHPLKNGTGLLIDYNFGVLMLPAIVSGVSFGSMLNIVAP